MYELRVFESDERMTHVKTVEFDNLDNLYSVLDLLLEGNSIKRWEFEVADGTGEEDYEILEYYEYIDEDEDED